MEGGASHHDFADLFPQQEFAGDQAGFDGLAESDVVGNEEVHARQAQGLSQGLELIGVETDTGPERRLKEVGISGGDAVPAKRVQVSRETLRRVEPAGGNGVPVFAGDDPGIQFPVPKDLEGLALGVIVHAGQPDEC